MKRNSPFVRKVMYLSAIAALFLPLSLISAPAKSGDQGGGLLTRMRRDEGLSQAQLGKIDPASAAMSLATFGLRGVAANQLWTQATKYKKTENWDAFKATLNQIAKLQPNFVSVWQYQAWNISYNVSVEFDDYRHRYHWVKKGVDYLLEGNKYNQAEPLLLWDTGWFFAHKVGRADEYRQFRRLFREDDDFHEVLRSRGGVDFERTESPEQASNLGPDDKPDNWKVAHEYFTRAQRAVDGGKHIRRLAMGYWDGTRRVIRKKEGPLKGKNPLVFFSDAPKALINYADAIEKDGYLDEVGQLAWQRAGRAWDQYGDRTITSSFGIPLRLNEYESNVKRHEEASARLNELAGDRKQELLQKHEATLTEAERQALETPENDRNLDQQQLAMTAEDKMRIGPMDLANLTEPGVRDEARKWARQLIDAEQQIRIVSRYRDIVNYIYWRDRCRAEQTDEMIQARRLILKADEALKDARLEEAKENFEHAWDVWARIFDTYDVLVDDVEGELIFEAVERYEKLMGQMDLPFPPDDFPLRKLVTTFADESMLNPGVADNDEADRQNEDPQNEDPKNEDPQSEDPQSEDPIAGKEDANPVADATADADRNPASMTEADGTKAADSDQSDSDQSDSDQSDSDQPDSDQPDSDQPDSDQSDSDQSDSDQPDSDQSDSDQSDSDASDSEEPGADEPEEAAQGEGGGDGQSAIPA